MTELKHKSLKCLVCGQEFTNGYPLSIHVRKEHGYSTYSEYQIEFGLIKSNQKLLDEGAIPCKICGLISHNLTSHIIRKHKLKIEDYKKRYGPIRSEQFLKEQSERISGDKNPAYGHGGKFSALSSNFIHADRVNKEEIIKKISYSNKNNGNNNTTLSYWKNQGFSEDESRLKIKERQTTFSLKKCIQKYGEVVGKARWVERQKKWLNSTKKSNPKGFSKVSQELFWQVFYLLDEDVKNDIYFAQLDKNKCKDSTGVNHEYTIKLTKRALLPDFVNIKTKKIIEFDGTYWHGKHKIKYPNRLRDDQRDKFLIEEGYEILHIKEADYRKNPEISINICLEFLNG
jgi:hypothetical protein